MRWINGVPHGNIIIGRNLEEKEANQFYYPIGLSLDRHGNLYVVDERNHQVQRFMIELKLYRRNYIHSKQHILANPD
ncbi:unnamed protein product [Rotaria sp. Silwood2]|nr:unnamed protein product [Rotaria sp. Silwood2]CAF4354829.1 unnamed protein product [Rotaria sp. Silwood2]